MDNNDTRHVSNFLKRFESKLSRDYRNGITDRIMADLQYMCAFTDDIVPLEGLSYKDTLLVMEGRRQIVKHIFEKAKADRTVADMYNSGEYYKMLKILNSKFNVGE